MDSLATLAMSLVGLLMLVALLRIPLAVVRYLKSRGLNMPMSELVEEWRQMVDDCVARESRLNEWEEKFIIDISDRLDNGKSLTEGQSDKLNEVWERITKKG